MTTVTKVYSIKVVDITNGETIFEDANRSYDILLPEDVADQTELFFKGIGGTRFRTEMNRLAAENPDFLWYRNKRWKMELTVVE